MFTLPLGEDAEDGASVLLTEGGVAVVNGTRRFARRRLTLAHEIGHYLFADEYSVDLRKAAVATASQFQVGMSTLAQRLQETGMATTQQAAQVRDIRTTRADIVDFNLVVPPNPQELTSPELPRIYEQAVLNAYRKDIISAARATEFLLDTWDEADLPDLPPLPEDAIWSFVS